MNRLSFDDPSLDLDPTLSLNDPSEIDTALLSDIDGKEFYIYAWWLMAVKLVVFKRAATVNTVWTFIVQNMYFANIIVYRLAFIQQRQIQWLEHLITCL